MMIQEFAMARNVLRTGKKSRPKTAPRGKRYLCARCRKRSPKPIFTPAPWICESCRREEEAARQAMQRVAGVESSSPQP